MVRIQFLVGLVFFLSACFASKQAFGQKDSLHLGRNKQATVTIDTLRDGTIVVDTVGRKKWGRPEKAMLWGLAVPGGGQIYNKKFWKLPIIYVGVGAVAYFWITNQQGQAEFKSKYLSEYDLLDADPAHSFIYFSDRTQRYYSTVNQLSTERDYYRRLRDFSIAGAVALYVVSVLDAYVDAHLSTFDISPDLSLSVKPVLFAQNNANFVTGLSLGLNFKNNRKTNFQLSNH